MFDLDTELHRVDEDFGIDVMGAIALEAAYSQGGEWLDALTAYLAGNLEVVQSGLADSGADIEVVRPGRVVSRLARLSGARPCR